MSARPHVTGFDFAHASPGRLKLNTTMPRERVNIEPIMTSNIDLEILDISTMPAAVKHNGKQTFDNAGQPSESTFTPKRYRYLDEHLDALVAMEGKCLLMQTTFWETVFSGYWERFPWFLPFDKDPENDRDLREPQGVDSEEMIAIKAVIVETTQHVRIVDSTR